MAKKKKTKTILFVEKKDETKELWTGKRLGKIEAKKRFHVDKVFCNWQTAPDNQFLLHLHYPLPLR